jgi:restriction system protein
MAVSWREYQEEAAGFFRGLGLEAITNFTVQGVRTKHAIDVFVKSQQLGLNVIWIVECKKWKKRISKLHVLALREIVTELGADRGIILSEVGFQKGAVEAAKMSNVHLTSLANIRTTAGAEITQLRVRELYRGVEGSRSWYWEIPKDMRIAHGLRQDFAPGYSGAVVLTVISELVGKVSHGVFPFESYEVEPSGHIVGSRQYSSTDEILAIVEPLLADLEARLESCDPQHKYGGGPPNLQGQAS